jgi:hypothetical protein
LKNSFLLAFLQELAPLFRDNRFEILVREIVQLPADDLLPRDTQKFADAYAGLAGQAVVVREQYRRGGVKDNGAEQKFEFFRTVFEKPTGWRLRLRGGGAQNAFLLAPAIQGLAAGRTELSVHPTGSHRNRGKF